MSVWTRKASNTVSSLTVPVDNAQNDSRKDENWTTDNTDSNNCGSRRKCIYDTSTKVIRKTAVDTYINVVSSKLCAICTKYTFKVLPESVEDTSSRNCIMEPDIREQDGLQKSFVENV